jgi:hypothetical protein
VLERVDRRARVVGWAPRSSTGAAGGSLFIASIKLADYDVILTKQHSAQI